LITALFLCVRLAAHVSNGYSPKSGR